MPRYTIVESVGSHIEDVNRYEDLEKHHPSSGREPGRDYQTINGRLEEVRHENGTTYVKKDFVLEVNGSDRNVQIPSPAAGYVHHLNDGTNAIRIYDKPFGTPGAHFLGQVLHTVPGSNPAEGARIEYGKPIGTQGSTGSGAIHAHVELPVDQFKQYIGDIAQGRIQTGGVVTATPPANTRSDSGTLTDKLLEKGEDGPGVKRLQESLNAAGIKVNGQPLPTTGHFGDLTEAAVKQYQQQKGLEVDGRAGKDTLSALGIYPGQQQAPSPTPTQPQPQQPQQPQQPSNGQQNPYGFGPDNELGKLIGRGEGSYNSYNRGNAGDSGKPINLSDMTVGEVMRRQHLPHNDPNYLFAVGKYQFVPNTLDETVNALGIDKNAKFTPQLQEKMFADYLIDEKRPQVHDYITGKTSGGQGLERAQHALALEFASVGDPRNGGRSAYDGVAGNSASIKPTEVQTALDHMREQYQKNVQSGMSADQAYKALSGDPNKYTQSAGATGQTQGQSGGLDDKLLIKGEDGPGVKRLQESLNAAGIKVNGQPLPTTGHFGDLTEAAVKQYQQQKGLEVDGKAGKDTLTALGIYPGQQQAPVQPQTPKADTPQPTQPQPPTNGTQNPPSDKPPTSQTQPAPTQAEKPSIADPRHPDHALYEQAKQQLQQLGPSGGFKSAQEMERAAAAVAADAKASGLTSIDHVAKTSAANGNQTLLVAVQGDPTNPASKNSYVDYNQATTQTLDQSSRMAETARTQQAQQPDPAQQQDQPRLAAGAR